MASTKKTAARYTDDTRCAACGAKPDAGMRERLANGDADICEPCYRAEYDLDDI